MIQKRRDVRARCERYHINSDFADHCDDMPATVCAECGGTTLTEIDQLANHAHCKDCGYQVPLAPCLEAIYGAEGNHILDGGTGEMTDGRMSISGKRWELFKANPPGKQRDDLSPGIRYIDTSQLTGMPKDSAW